ncbi:unnamed protein product [Staurois parvus]|uniref:Uncharacterized protein n=1 Tax=Staurois parvus TaxID=386267 RepID=A0ABN9EKW6_9NEOB|nr:unnamed protein product [Staurois parvus]
MSPLQRPRPSPLADAGIRLPGSVPCECRDVRGRTGTYGGWKFKSFNKIS